MLLDTNNRVSQVPNPQIPSTPNGQWKSRSDRLKGVVRNDSSVVKSLLESETEPPKS